MSSVTPPKGMRDFAPKEFEQRNKLLENITSVLTQHGFQQIETPALEDICKLKAKEGGDNESMLFEVLRRGLSDEPIAPTQAVDLGLRYDLTLPLSRFYAHKHAELPSVFRAFQTGWVWRAERPQKGRFRQFRQCDLDILGSSDWTCEVELLSLAWKILEKLELSDESTLLINDRRLLDSLACQYHIAKDKVSHFFIILDKLEKIGKSALIKELVDEDILEEHPATELIELLEEMRSGEEELLGKLLTEAQIPELLYIIQALKDICPSMHLRFDPTLVRGMGYYTATVYEVVHTNSSSSICGGGRYDKIIGKWLNKEIPAVGFSFGFERIISLLEGRSQIKQNALALSYTTPEDHLQALKLRQELMRCEIPYEVIGLYKAPNKLKQSFFDRLAQDYSAVILPSALKLRPHEALEQRKEL